MIPAVSILSIWLPAQAAQQSQDLPDALDERTFAILGLLGFGVLLTIAAVVFLFYVISSQSKGSPAKPAPHRSAKQQPKQPTKRKAPDSATVIKLEEDPS